MPKRTDKLHKHQNTKNIFVVIFCLYICIVTEPKSERR